MRSLALLCAVLGGLSLVLLLENRAVRADQNAMAYSYGSFLAQKVGGKPLSANIHMGSLAVFRSNQGMVGCAVLKGDR